MKTLVRASLILVAVLIAAGFAFSIIAGLFFSQDIRNFFSSGNTQREGIEKTITMPASDIKTLNIDLVNANITIVTADTDKATIVYKQFEDEKIEELNSNGTFGLKEEQKFTFFFFNFKNLFRNNAHPITITLPSSVKIETILSIVNGKIDADKSAYTNVRINSVNSSIILSDIVSDTDIYTEGVNGEIRFTNVTAKNKLTMKTVNGAINADNIAAGETYCNTVNGGIKTTNILCPNIRCETVNGGISASIYGEMNNYNIKFNSVNGNIYIGGSKYGKDIDINTNNTNKIKLNTINGKADLSFIK